LIAQRLCARRRWVSANPVLQAFARFNTVSNKVLCKQADKVAILRDLETLGVLHRSAAENLQMTTHPFSGWAQMREDRGDFIKQPRSGSAEIVASARNAWIGWVELLSESVNEVATHMTARVIDDVGADVLAVVEADNRPWLVGLPHRPLRLMPPSIHSSVPATGCR
jgi:hypothetical protein